MMELTSIQKECYLSAVGKNVLCVNDSGRRYIRRRYVHDMSVQFFCISPEREYSRYRLVRGTWDWKKSAL